MQISISNAIESLRRGGARIIQFGLQLWLDFNKSEIIGSDLVVNGDFATDSDWTKGTGWTISGGNAIQSGGNGQLSQAGILVANREYSVSVVIDSINVGGELTIALGSGATSLVFTESGTKTGVAAINEVLYVLGNSTFAGSISNISVKEVTQFVKDKSPNTNNAKLFTGKALSFDGVNDSVDIANYNISGDRTFLMQFKTNSSSSTRRLINLPTDIGSCNISINNGVINCYDGTNNPTTTSSFNDGIWHRLVVVMGTNNFKIYVDNVNQVISWGVGIDGEWINQVATNKLLSIGSNSAGSSFEGDVSNVQIWGSLLLSTDVAFDYNNPNHLAIDNPDTSLVVTDLEAYWALSEGDGLVAYDSGSTVGANIVQNGDFSELGSELLVNGDFSNGDTGWVFSPEWSVNAQNQAVTQGVTKTPIYQDVLVNGTNEVTFTLVSGKVSIYTQTPAFGVRETYETPNTYTISLESDDSIGNFKRLYFYNKSSGIGCVVANISVKQVDPNDDWVKPSGWGVSDSSIVSSSGNGSLTQDIGVVAGETYLISINILTFTSGTLYIDLGGSSAQTYTTEGIKSFNLTTTSTGLLRFYGGSFLGSITNITVTEITPSAHGGLIVGATYTPAQDTIPQLGMMDWAKGSNLYLSSEPTGAEGPGSDVTYGSYSWGLNGFSNATIFGDNSVLRYRYGATILASTEYTISCFVIMDDLSEPNVSLVNGAGDFCFVLAGTAATGVINANQSMGNNIWRVSKTATSGTGYLTNNGVIKYTGQSSTGFKVVGWQIEQASSAGNYILTDGAAAIDVTTIQNPTNKGYDIFGNPLRLREGAFNLDGTGYAEVLGMGIITDNFTTESWVKLSDGDFLMAESVIVELGNSLFMFGGTMTYIRAVNGGFTNQIVYHAFEPNVWYNIAVTRVRNGDQVIYIDGSLISTLTAPNTAVNINNVTIGKDSTTRTSKSMLDGVLIYDRALTQKEITQNYNVGLPAHTNPSSYSGDYSSDYGF